MEATAFYDALERRITSWAEGCPELQSAMVVGSRARTEPPPDQWADLDLILFLSSREPFIQRIDWVESLGSVLASMLSRTAGGDPERLVLFEGGFQADFVLDEHRRLEQWIPGSVPPAVVQRGARVVIDKTGHLTRLLEGRFAAAVPPMPSQEQFDAAVQSYWFIAVYYAKQILRDDPWVARVREQSLGGALLRMLEWHARSRRGWDLDTWYMGRHMREWLDPITCRSVLLTFAAGGRDDCARALRASMELFRSVATETASRLGLTYLDSIDGRVSAWMQENLPA